MATRLYFSSTTPAPITPNGENIDWWLVYSDVLLMGMNTTKSDSAFATVSKTQRAGDTYGSFVLAIQFVSPPLTGPGVIANPFNCQFRVMSSSGSDVNNAMTVRIVSNDGSVDRLINEDETWPFLLDSAYSDGAFENTFTNYSYYSEGNDYYGPRTINYQDGDRIVIDVGFYFNCQEAPLPCNPDVGYIEIGDAAASDLPEDFESTEQFNPWIEFTENLTFKEEEPPVVFTPYRKFPVPPDYRMAQSHQGKRQFPVIR